MAEEIMVAIASALAAKAADAVAGAAHEAWARLVRLVRAWFGGDAPSAAALEAACGRPGDREAVYELAVALGRAALADPEFGAGMSTGPRAPDSGELTSPGAFTRPRMAHGSWEPV